ncbi:FUSC family protein [Flavobacterium sp. Sd200]|uniref:FUSC family protein n=1 Tax=Flavobacterium sp. Sd200 TaxID=2692211 RepID=UPI00136E50C7|nr:FUSC family protein [Flavobacterium sp. Sd200]MXN92656.1 FUSC family protein [Flavobacterium sp. Sd200]
MELREMTDEQLLKEEKELRSFSIMNAFLIGFLLSIIFISIYYSAYGVGFVIALFLIYRLVKDPKNKRAKELKAILKERNLK